MQYNIIIQYNVKIKLYIIYLFEFQVRLIVSLTTMLVMYTLLSHATSQLPETAYIKLLDIWMFFCIFFLFFIIMTHFGAEVLELKREKKKSIIPEVKPTSGSSTINSLVGPIHSSKLKGEEKLLWFMRSLFFPLGLLIFMIIYVILVVIVWWNTFTIWCQQDIFDLKVFFY